ncbi:MAG: porin, partial [Betaproteobacteria bacterium]|nr:porin [Betaproteobacteria bacterium]
MNKKVMALAVAGAFVMPAAAFAQASNVQVFGTMYMEYSYSHQGAKVPAAVGGPSLGDLVNTDLLQTPGSEIGIKGEEALGGGNAVWFQCASTADIRGAGTGGGIQGFCGRNSAIGLKGSWGNAFAGNWDSPLKADIGAARIVSDTGIWGAGPMLFGNSSSFNDNGSSFAWSRRQNNSISYHSPVWSGFQVKAMFSTPSSTVGNTTNASGGKPRLYSLSARYSNGPLMLTAGYEQHTNFAPAGAASTAQTGGALAGVNTVYTGSDSAFQLGGTYQIGPVKAG